ncbi:hypothetical protein RhiirC2_102701 [Rhizophagus irregularis]|uniref:Uncharacterized protein n=1 Tax=Rhizophagus irregularis TaxID=588596 RepID=A0A2N1NTG2_9GLOM|nr:hypothetical protein RhiirC2_102701 [Rhizophagus irregularis]
MIAPTVFFNYHRRNYAIKPIPVLNEINIKIMYYKILQSNIVLTLDNPERGE